MLQFYFSDKQSLNKKGPVNDRAFFLNGQYLLLFFVAHRIWNICILCTALFIWRGLHIKIELGTA